MESFLNFTPPKRIEPDPAAASYVSGAFNYDQAREQTAKLAEAILVGCSQMRDADGLRMPVRLHPDLTINMECAWQLARMLELAGIVRSPDTEGDNHG